MTNKQSQKLPDGVGKRIIEALKQQTEQPTNPNELSLVNPQEGMPQQNYQHHQEQQVNPAFAAYMQQENFTPHQQQESPSFQQPYTENEQLTVDENDFSLNDNYNAPVQEVALAAVTDMQQQQVEPSHCNENAYQQGVPEYVEVQEEEINNSYVSVDAQAYEQTSCFPQPQQQEIQQLGEQQQKQPYVHSSNIDTLMWLINQLPSGVTKQTGAHIIRQTMEALGMPMNIVLSEAQQIQDTTNHSIRTKINSIEEYRNNIRILETEVQKERKQVEELEDLISLFILSEKN